MFSCDYYYLDSILPFDGRFTFEKSLHRWKGCRCSCHQRQNVNVNVVVNVVVNAVIVNVVNVVNVVNIVNVVFDIVGHIVYFILPIGDKPVNKICVNATMKPSVVFWGAREDSHKKMPEYAKRA